MPIVLFYTFGFMKPVLQSGIVMNQINNSSMFKHHYS